jgi:hypothetical protein
MREMREMQKQLAIYSCETKVKMFPPANFLQGREVDIFYLLPGLAVQCSAVQCSAVVAKYVVQ